VEEEGWVSRCCAPRSGRHPVNAPPAASEVEPIASVSLPFLPSSASSSSLVAAALAVCQRAKQRVSHRARSDELGSPYTHLGPLARPGRALVVVAGLALGGRVLQRGEGATGVRGIATRAKEDGVPSRWPWRPSRSCPRRRRSRPLELRPDRKGARQRKQRSVVTRKSD
jgi:hypothetical protein